MEEFSRAFQTVNYTARITQMRTRQMGGAIRSGMIRRLMTLKCYNMPAIWIL